MSKLLFKARKRPISSNLLIYMCFVLPWPPFLFYLFTFLPFPLPSLPKYQSAHNAFRVLRDLNVSIPSPGSPGGPGGTIPKGPGFFPIYFAWIILCPQRSGRSRKFAQFKRSFFRQCSSLWCLSSRPIVGLNPSSMLFYC